MRVYRSKQNWVPRKLFSLEPGKLVLCICNDQQLACYPSLPYCHPHPPTPQKTGSKKYFKSQAENWKMSCLSVWIKVYVSVSLVFFDNIAQVLSSDFNGLKTRQPFQIKLLEIQENIDLNECQSPVNWELVNIKYLVFLVLLLHYRHV